MMLILNNRQKTCRLDDAERLRRIWQRAAELADLQRDWPGAADLAVALLGPRAMARVNRQFLGHQGPTDVLAFDYRGDLAADATAGDVAAEIFVCPAVARANAERFATTVSSETVLYGVHGLLHLAGGRDKTPAGRRAMQRQEQQLMRRLREEFDLEGLFAHGRDAALEQ